jgi:hypothetical protein
MGRPIKNKFINPVGSGTSQPFAQRYVSGANIGGEAVTVTSGNASPTFSDIGLGYFSANASATVSAPELAGGTTATISTVYLFANGAIKALGIGTAGSGYTADPTVTFFGANTTPAAATVAINAATTTANGILANCFFPGTSSGVLTADIRKQRGSRSFMVANVASFTKQLKLVTSDGNLNPFVAGTMTITATFADASTFSVAKITNRKVYSSTGQSYKYTLTTGAAANVSASDITVVVSSL